MEADVLRRMQERHLHVKEDWLTSAVRECQANISQISLDKLVNMVFKLFLHSDLAVSYVPQMTIPTAALKLCIVKPLVFQIVGCIDISSSIYQQHLDDTRTEDNLNWFHGDNRDEIATDEVDQSLKKKSIFKLKLSNGQQTVHAMEFGGILSLPNNGIQPGTKVILTDKVVCRRGILMLNDSKCKFLGGKVDSLFPTLEVLATHTKALLVKRDKECSTAKPSSCSVVQRKVSNRSTLSPFLVRMNDTEITKSTGEDKSKALLNDVGRYSSSVSDAFSFMNKEVRPIKEDVASYMTPLKVKTSGMKKVVPPSRKRSAVVPRGANKVNSVRPKRIAKPDPTQKSIKSFFDVIPSGNPNVAKNTDLDFSTVKMENADTTKDDDERLDEWCLAVDPRVPNVDQCRPTNNTETDVFGSELSGVNPFSFMNDDPSEPKDYDFLVKDMMVPEYSSPFQTPSSSCKANDLICPTTSDLVKLIDDEHQSMNQCWSLSDDETTNSNGHESLSGFMIVPEYLSPFETPCPRNKANNTLVPTTADDLKLNEYGILSVSPSKELVQRSHFYINDKHHGPIKKRKTSCSDDSGCIFEDLCMVPTSNRNTPDITSQILHNYKSPAEIVNGKSILEKFNELNVACLANIMKRKPFWMIPKIVYIQGICEVTSELRADAGRWKLNVEVSDQSLNGVSCDISSQILEKMLGFNVQSCKSLTMKMDSMEMIRRKNRANLVVKSMNRLDLLLKIEFPPDDQLPVIFDACPVGEALQIL